MNSAVREVINSKIKELKLTQFELSKRANIREKYIQGMLIGRIG